MAQIIPAILVHSPEEYFSQLNAVDHLVPRIHIDIADGQFVPNTTWADPEAVRDATPVDIELHLMVHHPEKEIKRWQDAPQVKRIIIHVEADGPHAKTIANVRAKKTDVSMAINPETPIETLKPYLPSIQGVLFMGVNPGFQGQKFVPEVIEKIKQFKALHPNLFTAVDGHVDAATIPKLLQTGVDALCVGSAIFHSGKKPEKALQELQELVEALT